MRNLKIKLAAKRSALTGITLSAAALLALKADAQDILEVEPELDEYTSTTSIEGLANAQVLADGSVELTFEDGRTLIVPVDDVVLQNGEIFVDLDSGEGLLSGLGDVPLGVKLAGIAAGIGGIAALASGGDDGPGNAAPDFSGAASSTFAENGTGVAYTASASDRDADPVTFSISGGADAALFGIDASTGEVRFLSVPDFEMPGDAGGDNTYQLQIAASDGTDTTARDVTITVSNENDNAPEFTGAAAVTIAENETATGYTATVSDADGSALTYSIVGGADAALFAIDAATGVLSFINSADFDAPGDSGGNNVYDVIVQVSDGVATDTQAVQVTVTNENDIAPAFSSGMSISVAEGGTATGYTAVATDAEGDSITYSLAGGADAALFSIDAATGVLSFVAAPDFEAPADAGADNQYDVVIQASDGVNGTDLSVQVNVTNENDSAPVFTSDDNLTSPENTNGAVFTATATDADGSTLTYAIAGGPDAAQFAIDPNTGAVTFAVAPADFETPTDLGADNAYNLIISASDGVATTTQAVRLTVTNENDNAPTIEAGTDSVVENTTGVVLTVSAGDADGDALTFAIAGGADAALFTVDASTGALSFIAPPDFDTPADADTDNIFQVDISASDGTFTSTDTATIVVSDINDETPVFTSGVAQAVDENLTATGYVATATDADGTSPTFAITGGADAALFTIDTNSGALSFINAPDFENPGDAGANNVYDVEITASDGVNSAVQSVAVTVNDVVSEAPIFSSGSTGTLAENATGPAYTAVAVDPNSNPVTYSLSGTDSALFSINATTGEITFIASPDFEAPGDAGADNVYDIIVTADDGTDTSTQAVAISVTNENDNAPVNTSVAAATTPENTTGTVYTATATDADGSPVTWSIAGGADAAAFSIDPNTGEVSFAAAPADFEVPTDTGADNVYDLIVRASDGVATADQAVALTVTDVNEAPMISSAATASTPENTTVPVHTVAATDPESDPVTYSITGGADAALFTIDASTGEVSFNTSPDREAPTDAGGNNVYDIEVTASDGALSSSQAVAITVTNVNDVGPTTNITSPANIGRAEDILSTGLTYTNPFFFTDADTPQNALTYSLAGADAALFTLNTTTEQLEFVTPPDFENPADANSDNTYEIDLVASDGTFSASATLHFIIANLNDTAPIFTNSGTGSILENSVGFVYDGSATDPDSTTIFYSLAGADAGLFSLNTLTGEVTLNAPLDFEAPTDSDTNGIYEFSITATDGLNQSSQNVAITVTDVTNPVFVGTTDFSVIEGNGSFPNIGGVAIGDGTLTYSIVGGADAGDFIVSGNQFALLSQFSRDFENPGDANSDNIYEVLVQASDGTNATTHLFTWTIEDRNEFTPVITSVNSASTPENFAGTVYTATASDGDGSAVVTFTLGGTDAALFTINSATGEVSFVSPPDFEAPADNGADNVYDIVIGATDGTRAATPINVQITVTDVGGSSAKVSFFDASDLSDDPDGASPMASSIPEFSSRWNFLEEFNLEGIHDLRDGVLIEDDQVKLTHFDLNDGW